MISISLANPAASYGECARIANSKPCNAVGHSLGCQLLDEGKELELVRDLLRHTRSDMTL